MTPVPYHSSYSPSMVRGDLFPHKGIWKEERKEKGQENLNLYYVCIMSDAFSPLLLIPILVRGTIIIFISQITKLRPREVKSQP